MNDEELKQLWKSQTVSDMNLPVAEIRARAGKLQRDLAQRNAVEYAACLLIAATFCAYLFLFPQPLLRAGSVLTMLGVAVVAWQLRARASARPLPADAGARSSIDFLRSELERQRDALRSVWLWYIGPMLPGVIVFRWGVETQLDASAPFARGWTVNLVLVAIFLAVIALNRFAAYKLQRKLDALPPDATDPL